MMTGAMMIFQRTSALTPRGFLAIEGSVLAFSLLLEISLEILYFFSFLWLELKKLILHHT